MSAWSWSIRRSITSASRARSAVAAERATTVHEATDLVARGLKSGAPLLIDVPIDRALR